MSNQKGFTIVATRMVCAMFGVVFGLWIANAIKFAYCDFDAPYRCEIVHGVGVVIPPLAIVTAWWRGDNE